MLAALGKSGERGVGVSESLPRAKDDRDGHPVGFAIDVARKLAQDLGVTFRSHPAPLHDLISGLWEARNDLLFSSG